MNNHIAKVVFATALTLGAVQTANAALITDLVFKLSDSTSDANKLDALSGWTTPGGFNEGNASAQNLTDNGLDYKSTLVDIWPGSMTNVRVAFYNQGAMQAYVDFDPAGTSNTNFFTQANVVGSTWSDVTGGGNFFSIPGHAAIDRHWYINNNYGGCGVDVGHMVVVDGDGSQPCFWENSRLNGNDRAFLYSLASTEVNWNTNNIGIADVFAVFVTRDVPDPTGVPTPAPLALLGLGLAVLGLRRKA